MPNSTEVLVVGAGIAGLHSARALHRAGRDVRVVEARDRVGGRLWSVPAGPGGALDLGATWFWPGEERVAALVEELAVPIHPQYREADAVYEDPRGVQRLTGNPLDVPSSRFTLGAQSLTEGLAAGLPAGTVRLSTPVTAVAVTADGVDVTTAGGTIHAETLVLAVPPALAVSSIDFAPVLPDEVARVASRTPVWMGGTAKVVVRYREPLWRARGFAGAAVSHRGPLREIHDMSGPGGSPAALFGFASPPSSPGGVEPLEESRVEAQLARMFGDDVGRPDSIRIVDWSRERWTTPQGITPSQRYDLYGHAALRRSVHGRIHFASTETAPAFAGHIEGALRAAEETARRIVGVS